MKVQGRCHCGDITYEAEVDPAQVRICHCTDCQNLSGSPFRTSVPTTGDSFVLKSGMPKRYVKTAESGTRRTHAFCPNCGSPVYSAAVEDTPPYALRIGCLDRRAELPPRRAIWCGSALAWARDIGDVPQTPRQ